MITAEQKEELRHCVLGILVARHPAALTIKQIFHRVGMELDFPASVEEVEAALEFQRGLTPANVALVPDDFGSTKYFNATSAGVLMVERKRK